MNVQAGNRFQGKSGAVYTIQWVKNHVVCLSSEYTNLQKYKAPNTMTVSEDVLHGDNWEKVDD